MPLTQDPGVRVPVSEFFFLLLLFYLLSGLLQKPPYLAEPETTVCCYINTAAWAYHKHHRTLLEYATRLQLLKGKARMTSVDHSVVSQLN